MTDLAPPQPDSGEPVGGEGPAPLGGPWSEPLLAADTVRFVGEPVAVVITDGRYQGEDAADLVTVDYDPLPAVVGPEAALTSESLLFPAAGSNIPLTSPVSADDAPFDACEVVVEQAIVNQRLACMPLEGRATAATFENGKLTVWHSSQNAQLCRLILCGALGMAPDQIRVIVPDVGGGFGAKVGIDRDGLVVAWAARKTGRALRWNETRSENLVGMTQGRAQLHHIKIGGNRDGKILAYRIDVIQDSGAYSRMGGFLPMLTCLMAPGVYDIPAVQAGYRVVVTNATPISAYRGAGRPEAAATIERAVDLFAAEIGMDPAEVRRINLLTADEFPVTTITRARYDTGDYPAALERALREAGYADLRREQRERRERGDAVQLGIGLSSFVEITGADTRSEYATVSIGSDGDAVVYTGTCPHCQGHRTAWAMIASDVLGVPFDRITVVHGDTAAIPTGNGTGGSRSLQTGGIAVREAALALVERGLDHAAARFGVDRAEVEFANGGFRTGDRTAAWTDLAARGAGLTAEATYQPSAATCPFGTHLAVVEVDTDTGAVGLRRIVAVDDAGVILNPLLAEGQIHGGLAQGVGQALVEEIRFAPDGTPLHPDLATYAMICAAELPSFDTVAMHTPTPVNPLGAKGLGESGAVGVPPAIQNAVVDALRHLGITHLDMPLTPERVWSAIEAAVPRKD
jgi:aerobic carbon-monoxide dehydrogenase large subunit